MAAERSCSGLALPFAVVALATVGVLVAGAYAAAMIDRRMTRNMLRLEEARAAAETGIAVETASWSPSLGSLAVGDRAELVGVTARGRYRGHVRRLDTEIFLLRFEGISSDGLARQPTAVLLRTPSPPAFPAAVAALEVSLDGWVQVDGRDECSTGESVPALVVPHADLIRAEACQRVPCLLGEEPVAIDPDLAAPTIRHLVGGATVRLDPGSYTPGPTVRNGTCDTDDVTNWGDPFATVAGCAEWAPVVLVDGDLTLSGGWGQALLLVTGNLTLIDGAVLHGGAIVEGRLSVTGTGGEILGAVKAAQVALGPLSAGGSARIGYSRCALARVLRAATRPSPLPQRAWIRGLE